jgi:ribosomal protein L22
MRPGVCSRGLSVARVLRADDPSTGSLFTDVTQPSETSNMSEIADSSNALTGKSEWNKYFNDPHIKSLMNPAAKSAAEAHLSPLKRQLYEKVVQLNNGVYVNRKTVELDGKKYLLDLTKEEQQALEPSMYIQSYDIKSSLKKTFPHIRFLRKMDFLSAITQCHFQAKKIFTPIGAMLERAKKDCVKLGFKPEDLYIDQIWVGKEPRILKRVDFKGRGRTGLIEHKWVHVKAILRPKSHLERQKALADAKLMNSKPYYRLRSPKHPDSPQVQAYRW